MAAAKLGRGLRGNTTATGRKGDETRETGFLVSEQTEGREGVR